MLLDLGVIDVLSVNEIIQREFEIENRYVNFICVPYPARTSIPALSRPLKEYHKNILVAHLLLKELGIPSEQADISLSQIPNWLNYIAWCDRDSEDE
jgi:hypothetical protein